MVTRSIVGRILILAVLIVSLGVITQAALIITHEPAKKNGSGQPGSGGEAAGDQRDAAPIRVVYPGPLGDGSAPVRKIADAAPASPLPAAASPATAMPSPTSASVGEIAQASASQEDFDTGEQRPVTPSSSSATSTAKSRDVDPSPPAAAVEVASADPGLPNTPVQPPPSAEASVRGININSASAEALNHLQGGGRIGQSIVQHRPYKSVEELVKKRVLRRAVYDQIKNQIAAQ